MKSTKIMATSLLGLVLAGCSSIDSSRLSANKDNTRTISEQVYDIYNETDEYMGEYRISVDNLGKSYQTSNIPQFKRSKNKNQLANLPQEWHYEKR